MLPRLSLKKTSCSSSSSSSGRMGLPQKAPPPTQPHAPSLAGDPAAITGSQHRPLEHLRTRKEFHRYDFTDENGQEPNDHQPQPSPPPAPAELQSETEYSDNHSSPCYVSVDSEAIDFRLPDIPPSRAERVVAGRTAPQLPPADEEDAKAEEYDDTLLRTDKLNDTTAGLAIVSVQVYGGGDDVEYDQHGAQEEEKVGDRRVHRVVPSRTADPDTPSVQTSGKSTDCGDDHGRLDLSYSSSSCGGDEESKGSDTSRAARTAVPAPQKRTTTRTTRRSGWDVEVCLGSSGRRDDADDRGSRARRGRRGRPGAIAYQSFAILQCSAPALVPHLVPIPRHEAGDEDGDSASHRRRRGDISAAAHAEPDPIYRLCLPNASLDDWRLLEPFLQPPTLAPTEFGVHTATLTPQHLVLLPWFVQLRLHVLLEQSDEILSRIAWDAHTDPIQELLVWSHIVHAAQLQRTSRQACHAWQGLLSPHSTIPGRGVSGFTASKAPPPHSIPPVMRLADDLEALASLCRLLEVWDDGRRHLWIHLVRYLPHDLDVFSTGGVNLDNACDAPGTDLLLLKNPLLPYLIREGIQRHCSAEASNDKSELSSENIRSEPTAPEPLAAPDDASLRSNRSTIGRTLLPLHPPSVTSTAKQASGRRRRGRPTPLEPRGAGDEVGEWQASFEQWFHWLVPMTQDEFEDVAADIVYCPSSRASSVVNDEDDNDNDEVFGHDGASVASSTPLADILAKIPADRLQWLEEIWRRLQEPPILPPLPASSAQESPDRAAPTSDRQRSLGHPDTPPKHTAQRRASRLAADFSTPPRSSRHAAAQYPESPGTTTEHSTSRSEQSSASASAASRARLRRYSSPDRSASPRRKSVATPGSCSATSSYCSKNDESNSSTLSTHPLNTSADGSEETSYSSIGVVRAKTRTFYC